MNKRFVGIDVSNRTLDSGYFEDENYVHEVFANSEQGFNKLLKSVKKRGVELVFCMEATGAYSTDLAEYLHENGYTVFVENARLIKAFRESENLRNVTDKNSALVIAQYAESKFDRLKKWQPLAPETKALRELTRLREALVESRIQWTNRLKSRSLRSRVTELKDLINDIKNKIRDVEDAIREHVRTTPVLAQRVELLRSINGIGFATAAVLLAELPQIDHFEDKRDLVAFAGLNPALRKSGTSINFKPMLSKKGSSRIRKALYMPAIVALRHNKRIQAFAMDLQERKKHNMAIVGAAMRKLICFVFGVLRSGQKYNASGDQVVRKTAA